MATFTDTDPNGNAKDLTATINWGDGATSVGTISALGGTPATINGVASPGFTVSGSHTYTRTGLFPINVDIFDFGGGPGEEGSMPSLAVNNTASVAAPQISSLGPTSLSAGSGDSAVSVFGSNFSTGDVVLLNGSPLATTFVSGTQLNAIVPATLLATPSNAVITVSGGSNAVVLAVTATPTPTPTPAPAPVRGDVTSLFHITVSKPVKHGKTVTLTVTLKNISTKEVAGAVALVLKGLPASIRLLNAVGLTIHRAKGSEFVIANSNDIGPGVVTRVHLVFSGNIKHIHYTPVILGGIVLP